MESVLKTKDDTNSLVIQGHTDITFNDILDNVMLIIIKNLNISRSRHRSLFTRDL